MHPFSVLTLGIFVAGYTTARWDLVTRLYELAIFAWDHGVVVSKAMSSIFLSKMLLTFYFSAIQTRAAKGFVVLSIFFFVFILPIERVAARETTQVRPGRSSIDTISHYLATASSIPQPRHIRP